MPIVSADVIGEDNGYYYHIDPFNYRAKKRFKFNENRNNVVYHKSYKDAKKYLTNEINRKLQSLESSKLKLEGILSSL